MTSAAGEKTSPSAHLSPSATAPPRLSSPVRGEVGGDQHSLHLLHTTAIRRRVRCRHHHHLLHVDTHIGGGHGSADRRRQGPGPAGQQGRHRVCMGTLLPSDSGVSTGWKPQQNRGAAPGPKALWSHSGAGKEPGCRWMPLEVGPVGIQGFAQKALGDPLSLVWKTLPGVTLSLPLCPPVSPSPLISVTVAVRQALKTPGT